MEEEIKLSKKEKRELAKLEKEKNQAKEEKSQLFRKIFLWSLGGLLVIGAFFLVKKSASFTPNLPTLSLSSVAETDWVKGKDDAKHILVEYSDFQCPACAVYHPLLTQLLNEYPDKVKLIYRHFPLRSIHKNADLAAYASEAAGRQGKFWEMHNLLFEKQKEWSESESSKEKMIEYATSLTLNIEQFKKDLESDDVKEKVNNSYLSAMQANLSATPTFFLDGEKISPRSYEEFVKLVL